MAQNQLSDPIRHSSGNLRVNSVRGDSLSAFIAAEKLMNPAHVVDVPYKPDDGNADYDDRVDRSNATLTDDNSTADDSSPIRSSVKISKRLDRADPDDAADKNR